MIDGMRGISILAQEKQRIETVDPQMRIVNSELQLHMLESNRLIDPTVQPPPIARKHKNGECR